MGSGLFCSPLILNTLAIHFTATTAVHEHLRATENPAGALLMAIVGVSCLLFGLFLLMELSIVRACVEVVQDWILGSEQ